MKTAPSEFIQALEPRILLSVTDFPEYRGANAQHQFGGNSDDMVQWNVNIVRETVQLFDRAPLGYGAIQVGGSWYHGLQGVVDRNRTNGIITILCPFSWDGEAILGSIPSQTSYWAQFNERLYELALQFKDQPDVWIEFWNEPYDWDRPTDPDQWVFDMQVMIGTVRSAGNMNKIVVPGGRMGGDETVVIERGWDLVEFDPAHNLVFDIHAYNYWFEGGYASMNQRMANMANSGLDFIFGEFGAYTPGGIYDVSPFLTSAKQHRFGALAWIWQGADSNRLFQDNGALNSSPGNYYWGEKARDYIMGAQTVLPGSWAIGNIGNPSPAASATYSGGTFTIQGAGSGITGTSDQFAFIHRGITGTQEQVVMAQVSSLQETIQQAQAGLMIRASGSASSPFIAITCSPSGNLRVLTRETPGGSVTVKQTAASQNVWLMLRRHQSGIDAYYATTPGTPSESDWTLLGSTSASGLLTSRYLAGLAVTSQTPRSLAMATFTNVTVAPRWLPDGWQVNDIGQAPSGDYCGFDGTGFLIHGGGTGLTEDSDQFRFVAQEVADDQGIVANVLTGDAYAGLMFRDGTAADAPFVALMYSPLSGLELVTRRYAGAKVARVAGIPLPAGTVLKLQRIGTRIEALYADSFSPQGWTFLGAVDDAALGYRLQVGLAVSSLGAGMPGGSAIFQGVSISTSKGLPSGWTNRDIGNVPIPGNGGHSGSALFASGSGNDIWGTADAFNYSYTTASGDRVLISQVTSLADTDDWAKAGVMFRASTNANSPFVGTFRTPANGISFQVRSAVGGEAFVAGSAYTIAPAWLKLVRSGDQFTAYYALTTDHPANNQWIPIGSVTNAAIGQSYLAGLALTSHNTNRAALATFRNTELIAPPEVASFVVNDGSAQRSVVRELTVTFTGQVSLTQQMLTLNSTPSGANDFVLTDVHGDGRTYRLTFASGKSLGDAHYQLSLDAGAIVGRENLRLAGENIFSFHRLFGDSDGDRDVDAIDFELFRTVMNRAIDPSDPVVIMFDWDGSGRVDAIDLIELRKNMLFVRL